MPNNYEFEKRNNSPFHHCQWCDKGILEGEDYYENINKNYSICLDCAFEAEIE